VNDLVSEKKRLAELKVKDELEKLKKELGM